MKDISLIIPCYNEGKNIKQIFETLRHAQGKLLHGKKLGHIIFVDNGSTDGTFEKISKSAQDYPEFSVTIVSYKEKLGFKKAASEGIKYSPSNINVVLSARLDSISEKLQKAGILEQPSQVSKDKFNIIKIFQLEFRNMISNLL